MSPAALKPKILVSVINNVSFDQRVEKTCETLQSNGYQVEVIGTQLRGTPPVERDYPVARMPLWFQKKFPLYAEFNLRLFLQLLQKSKKGDLLWANDLDSLLPNYLVSRIKGLKLVFDSHELFSETPAVTGRKVQKVWRFLEKKLITKPDLVITVSDSIGAWFQTNYNIQAPKILKNFPKKQPQWEAVETENYILYQGILNKGRGLTQLVESLKYIPEKYSLKIAGDGPFRKEVENTIQKNQLENRVELLGLIPPNELKSITQKAFAGVSLEEDLGLSYRYSLPNKLFDYIQAKTPIVGTYLPEIQKIIHENSIGEIIVSHDPQDIALAILEIENKGRDFYKTGLENLSETLNWESQEKELLTWLASL